MGHQTSAVWGEYIRISRQMALRLLHSLLASFFTFRWEKKTSITIVINVILFSMKLTKQYKLQYVLVIWIRKLTTKHRISYLMELVITSRNFWHCLASCGFVSDSWAFLLCANNSVSHGKQYQCDLDICNSHSFAEVNKRQWWCRNHGSQSDWFPVIANSSQHRA